jgi:o-succinylbenzoate---CoA ligase
MHPLEQLAANNPENTVLRVGDEHVSCQQLYTRAATLAAVLHEKYGLRNGHRLATLAENTMEHVVLLHAAWLLGVTTIPLNIRLGNAERRRQLELLRPDLFLLQVNMAAAHEGQSLSTVCRTEDLASLPFDASVDTFRGYEPKEQDILSILFTSGSTGQAKAVAHTWGQHRASAGASKNNLGAYADDAWLCIIPLFHIGGLAILVRCLLHGGAVVLPRDNDASTYAEELRHGVTLASLVPTVLHRILQADPGLAKANCPRLRAILLGGAPATETLWRDITRRGLPALGTYGMTESCSQVCTAPLHDAATYAGTAGLPLAGVELRIVDENGSIVEKEAQGEIQLRGPMIMTGYIDNPQLNAERFSDGWFCSGDVGMVKPNGALVVLGRRDDMILSGAENIHPNEIERVLLDHPGIHEAAVLGVADEEWGQKLAAALCPKSVDEEEIEQWCRERLGAMKTPRLWRLLDELPRSATGKVDRNALRALFSYDVGRGNTRDV